MDPSGGDPDLLEGGSDRPVVAHSRRWAFGLAVAAIVGLLVGDVVGHHRAPARAVPPTVTTTSPARPVPPVPSARPVAGPPIVQTGATCSVQHGRRLQLGVQIENQSASIVHVTGVGSREPLGGLRPLASRVGACAENSGLPVSFDPSGVLPGAATWLTVTVQVQVRCPAAYPVQFVVHYGQGDHAGAEALPGFVDLGHVPYTHCARTP
jgi:hypothetical protein